MLLPRDHAGRAGRAGACRRGDLEGARRWAAVAEAGVALWEGTAWAAALVEVHAAVARAEGRVIEADRLYASAAALFDTAGQPFDAARCRAPLAPVP
ncbi:hypothetical protein [Geodermatophilus sp. SYSU D00815]